MNAFCSLGGTYLPTTEASTTAPHLLRALHNYLDKLDSGGLSTVLLPPFHLRRRAVGSDQSQDQGPSNASDVHALTSSVCSILDSVSMPDQLQRMVEDAQESVRNHPEYSGYVQLENSSMVRTAANQASGEPYTHLPLLVAALGHMVSRANRLFQERASQSLQNACNLLLSSTQVDESNQELLVVSNRPAVVHASHDHVWTEPSCKRTNIALYYYGH